MVFALKYIKSWNVYNKILFTTNMVHAFCYGVYSSHQILEVHFQMQDIPKI